MFSFWRASFFFPRNSPAHSAPLVDRHPGPFFSARSEPLESATTPLDAIDGPFIWCVCVWGGEQGPFDVISTRGYFSLFPLRTI